jgi:hypothetical protein
MKSISILLFLLLFLNDSYGQIHIGLKAGANLANIAIDAPVDHKMKVGFHAGGMMQTRLSEKIIFQPELLFSQKGFEAPSISFIENQTESLNYISIPLLLRYKTGKNFSILLGPEVGFLVSATSKTGDLKLNVIDSYKKVDLGIDLALAYKIKHIGLDVRYNYGVTNLGTVHLRDRDGNTTYGATTKNRVLQIGVLYSLSK